jgi:CRISPR-associated exonuclease Cas4
MADDNQREWREEEWVLVSALEHYSYCPRQCALIHVERIFDENVFTLQGRDVHERAHEDAPSEEVDGVRIERGLPIWSEQLGIRGKADVVEFLPDGTPYPVEYKRGPRRRHPHADIQVCAQALCLEQMFGRPVPRGAVFHHKSRRRREVEFTPELRQATETAIREVRALLLSGETPPPPADARCPTCSLIEACMPYGLAALADEGPDIWTYEGEGSA